jgi:hypothetical protein
MNTENLRGRDFFSEAVLLSLDSHYFLLIYPELSRHVFNYGSKGRFAIAEYFFPIMERETFGSNQEMDNVRLRA